MKNAPAGASGEAPWKTIVGVVSNVLQRSLPSGEFDPVVYTPYAEDPPQFDAGHRAGCVRTGGGGRVRS